MADLKSLTNDVLKHADIVKIIGSYLPLVKKGKNYKAICPFHDDTDPSLTISSEKQFFKCFVCQTGGTAISFVQKYEHVPYMEAVKMVAELSGYHPEGLDNLKSSKPVDERRETLLKCIYDLNLYYQFALNSPEGKAGLDYFESRHLDSELRSKFKLGYAIKDGKATINFLMKKGHSIKTIEDIGIAKMISPGNYKDMNEGRVTFPICDQDGNVVGFSARRIYPGDEAKYMNSPETYLYHKSSVLYNFNNAKEAARLKGYIYICEGFMDVFALAKIGIDAAVAIMGTKLTTEYIGLLRTLNVELRLCLDGDLPGQSAMMSICNTLAKTGLKFRVVDNQGSSRDPDEILNEDGPEALQAYLNNLVSRIDFALNYYMRSNPLKTIDEKKKLIKEFVPILAKITDQLELDSYLRKLEKVTGFEAESIRNLVLSYNSSANKDKESVKRSMRNFHPERKALQKLETAEREFLFQMMGNELAIAFYEDKIHAFYDDIYRAIANYLIAYHETYEEVDINGVMTEIESSDDDKKEDMIFDITEILDEDFHPKVCTEELLKNLFETMEEEKERINDEDTLRESLEGKDELEQARIIAEHNRKKAKKESKK